ncbi:SH3 domain-containing protein [uncultured Phascolarctobacterium sp.]|uniref:SH3 domain-containing protein n=1 Tax=Phascolarctobacterium succinatutens TaxID=626940 RepID=UPI00262BF646|nr:SH3 domain-containing protein [uncultured Phascolarctobacterium sp.]
MKKIVKAIVFLLMIVFSNACFANEQTTKEFFEKPGACYLVLANNVLVRTHPTTNGYIICLLSKGDYVKSFDYNSRGILDSNGIYWKYIVMRNGNIGWVASRYLSLRC